MPLAASGIQLSPLPPPVQPKETCTRPCGEDWVYEFLWGGERVRAGKDEQGVRLLSREGRNLVNRFPRVAAAVAKLRAAHAAIDGEILLLDGYSREAVAYLAQVTDDISQSQVVLLAYDLIARENEDVRNAPLLGRRMLLASMTQGTPIILSPFVQGDCESALREAARLGLRGIVAKRAGSAYRPNALTTPWVKVTLPPRERKPAGSGIPAAGGALLRMVF